MKKISFCLLVASFSMLFLLPAKAQDTIYTKDRQEISCKVFEQSEKYLRYKRTDYEEGPLYTMRINRIEKVKYGNGITDLLGNQNPRSYRPLGLSAGMCYVLTAEAGFFILNMDYFIIPQIDLQLNIGTEFEGGVMLTAGSRFHLNSRYSKKRLSPFVGLLIGVEAGDTWLQVPIGISYCGNKGFTASLSLNGVLYWQAVFAELTMGYRFKI